ncbi:hypothetical protein Ddye_009317 [Dipteronia dyeriana]|uniref:Uncharacterized protein n=1 Tax=Dipteronia dyeriana TaxID=168575 RepID=A0AAD9XB51_9ROSI|nr:hypothetical protein Ddye_009317 [Dipteronia dyeriana]
MLVSMSMLTKSPNGLLNMMIFLFVYCMTMLKKVIYKHPRSLRGVTGVKPYPKRGLEYYEILGDIFNTTTATGQSIFSSSQVHLPSDEDRGVKDNFINSRVHVEKGKKPRRSIDSSNSRRKKKWDSMDSYFEVASEVMNARLVKVKANSVESTTKSDEQYFVTECMEALESLRDIDGDTFNKFMDRIVPCIESRKDFLAMTEERKRQWLDGL